MMLIALDGAETEPVFRFFTVLAQTSTRVGQRKRMIDNKLTQMYELWTAKHSERRSRLVQPRDTDSF